MIKMVGHVFYTDPFNVLTYTNVQLKPTFYGFNICGIQDNEEIFGKISFFNDVILDLFIQGKVKKVFSALKFSNTREFKTETGIPLQDPIYDDEML